MGCMYVGARCMRALLCVRAALCLPHPLLICWARAAASVKELNCAGARGAEHCVPCLHVM